MKDLDMNNLNPEFAEMVKKAMSDPELIRGIAEGLMGDNGNPADAMNEMIDGIMGEIKETISKVNDVIDSSESYDDLRDEIILLVENIVAEVAALITTICSEWYDNSEDIDIINANSTFRKYEAYIDAGFTEEQAFTLINKENKGSDTTTAVNNFINQLTKELNKRNN